MGKRVFGLVCVLALFSPSASAQDFVPSVDSDNEGSSKKRVGFTGIPIIDYNEVMGFGLGAFVAGFYRANPSDTLSPSSATGVFGFYSENKTWAAGAGQMLYLKEDTYRLRAFLGLAGINFQVHLGDRFGFLDYHTDATFGMLNLKRRVKGPFYAGLKYRYTGYRTTFGDSTFQSAINQIRDFLISIGLDPDAIADSLGIDPNLGNKRRPYSGLGVALQLDSRDNTMNPREGSLVEFETIHNRDFLGSSRDYNIIEFAANHYRPFGAPHVLAGRVYARLATGDVPFEDQSIFGQGMDLRGYGNGKHRGDQMYAAQAEWRWNFYKRWGMVAFGGFGWAVDSVDEIATDNILPAIGAGFRFMALTGERINIGLDIARGKDGFTYHIIMTEAF